MDFKKLWEKICFCINERKNSSEEEYQIVIENICDLLGWQKFEGDIDTQRSISFGASNHCIPDIILKKENKDTLCIEVKKYLNSTNERHEKQLLSYMRILKLSFGILWGNTLQVFYDNIADNSPAVKICEIMFNKEDNLGVELITNIYKDNFTLDNFQKFCFKQLELKTKEIETKEKIKFLCSDKGLDYIKQLLLIEYPEDVIKNLNIVVTNKLNNHIINNLSLIDNDKSKSYIGEISVDFKRKENETTQKYIKRVLYNLFRENKISKHEIENLHNKEYCKKTFGINYPLLFNSRQESFLGNGYRSWSDTIYNYYVCSQWNDKIYRDMYEDYIVKWVNRISKNI